eukprot:COSAG01_NODE_2975_length_6768_cov_33.755436_6_plen_256_part_00
MHSAAPKARPMSLPAVAAATAAIAWPCPPSGGTGGTPRGRWGGGSCSGMAAPAYASAAAAGVGRPGGPQRVGGEMRPSFPSRSTTRFFSAALSSRRRRTSSSARRAFSSSAAARCSSLASRRCFTFSFSSRCCSRCRCSACSLRRRCCSACSLARVSNNSRTLSFSSRAPCTGAGPEAPCAPNCCRPSICGGGGCGGGGGGATPLGLLLDPRRRSPCIVTNPWPSAVIISGQRLLSDVLMYGNLQGMRRSFQNSI